MYASIAICAALAHRAQSGSGQHLDLALLDSQIALLAYQNTNYFATGLPPERIGNLHPNIVPYQPFRAADGELILACGNDNLYNKFCEAAGCPELARDPRFATNGKRVENRAELTRLLAEVFKKRSTREWLELLEAAGVPNGPINDIAQVFEEPQVKARGVRIELDHGAGALVGNVRDFHASHRPEKLAGEVVRRAVAGGAEVQLAGVRFAKGDQVAHRVDVAVLGMDYDHVGNVGEHRDRDEIALERVRQLRVQALRDGVVHGTEEEVIPVRGALRRRGRSNSPARSGKVLDQELLAERFAQ